MNTLRVTYCCTPMSDHLHNDLVPLHYGPIDRFYYLTIQGSSAAQGLVYCPWCGIQLPKELGDEYYDTLLAEYDIRTNADNFTDDQLPEEFKSDLWWKKRGL